jgi:hypothetical protein
MLKRSLPEAGRSRWSAAALLLGIALLGAAGCADPPPPPHQVIQRQRKQIEKVEADRQQQLDELDAMEAEARPQPEAEDDTGQP